MREAFPGAMRRAERRLRTLRHRVAGWPDVAPLPASPRRIAFNETGTLRRDPDQDR